MGFLRKLFRLLKYRIKFLNKNDNAKINYFVQSRFLDTNLTNLMDHYGSDKGGLYLFDRDLETSAIQAQNTAGQQA